MKKFLVLSIFFIITVTSVYADSTLKQLTTKPFRLQAGYGAYAEVTITPRSAQPDSSFNIGMPFNIEDTSVLYNTSTSGSAPENAAFGSGSGRLIADWFFLANTDFSFAVVANPLKHVSDESSPTLKYSLAFEFTLGYTYKSGNKHQLQAFLIYDGNTGNNYLWYPKSTSGNSLFPYEFSQEKFQSTNENKGIVYDESIGCNTVRISNLTGDTLNFIGSATGVVYFGFTESATDIIKQGSDGIDSLASGDYTANVTVYMKGV